MSTPTATIHDLLVHRLRNCYHLHDANWIKDLPELPDDFGDYVAEPISDDRRGRTVLRAFTHSALSVLTDEGTGEITRLLRSIRNINGKRKASSANTKLLKAVWWYDEEHGEGAAQHLMGAVDISDALLTHYNGWNTCTTTYADLADHYVAVLRAGNDDLITRDLLEQLRVIEANRLKKAAK